MDLEVLQNMGYKGHHFAESLFILLWLLKDLICNGLNMFSRLARETGLDYVEMQNLTEFYDDNRYMGFPSSWRSSGFSLVPTEGLQKNSCF